MEISVARALTELNILDDRIDDKIDRGLFIGYVKKSSKKVDNIFTREEFEKNSKADYQSITDLIERRRIIKSAIVKSNATTLVKVGDKEYTVADAIERKKYINVESRFLSILERQYKNAVATVATQNEKVDKNLDNLLNSSLSAETKKEMNLSAFSEAYRSDNYYEVVDGLNLKDKISLLKDDILKFQNEINLVLNESNAITKIEIPD